MKKIILLFLLLSNFLVAKTNAQAVEWKDVAAIFYDNCAVCHRPGEIGDGIINAMGYTKLINSDYFGLIPSNIEKKLMPPWPVDPHYREFLDQRILTDDEINLISTWVNEDSALRAGDTSLAPPPPYFTPGSQLGTPDNVLTMAQPFTVIGDGADHYQVFVLPTNDTSDQEIKAIEFRPGNSKIVHHAFIYTCDDNTCDSLDALTPEYGYPSFGGAGEGANVNFITLWGPGMNPRFYPEGAGLKFKAGTKVVIQIHYAPTYTDQTDQTSVNLFYGTDQSYRNVKGKRVGEDFLIEPVFFIVKNKILTFHQEYTLDTTYSMFSIAPHMHLLGKSFKIYAQTPEGDSIPLVYSDVWDFRWQLIYQFPMYQIMQKGTIIKTEATYDNTDNNPNNPNSPPANVGYGESSFTEMCKFFMNLLVYQPGDEDVIFDSTWHPIFSGVEPVVSGIVFTPQLYTPIPNPASDHTVINYYLPNHGNTRLSIYDLNGRLVMSPFEETSVVSGFHRKTIYTSEMIAGTYFCTLETDGKRITKSFIVQH